MKAYAHLWVVSSNASYKENTEYKWSEESKKFLYVY